MVHKRATEDAIQILTTCFYEVAGVAPRNDAYMLVRAIGHLVRSQRHCYLDVKSIGSA